MKCTPFSQSLVAYFERKACNVLCYSILRKLLKTREFRAKDFFARSVRSFERLKMQILCWDVGQKPHPRPLPRREGSNMHFKI